MGLFKELKKGLTGFHNAGKAVAKNPFSKDAWDQHISGMHIGLDTSEKYKNGVLRPPASPYSNDPSKAGSASDRMGNLIRAQWDDYVTRFQPYDKKLIGLATGTADNEEAIAKARGSVAGSFDVSQGTLQRNRQRLGLANTTDSNMNQERNLAMARSLAEVNAVNGTRIAEQDRDRRILGGGAAAGLKGASLQGA